MVDNSFLSDKQHGCVRGRSSTTQFLKFAVKLTKMLDRGETIDMIYLDFAKAFDTASSKAFDEIEEIWGRR